MFYLVNVIILWWISSIGTYLAQAIDQQSFELSTTFEQDYTITSVLMQSVVLPCKAILLVMEPEQVKHAK